MKRKTEGLSKREVRKLCGLLEKTHIPLLSIMNIGKSFADCNQGGLSGYTLSDAVGAIAREIIAKMREGGLLTDTYEESKPQLHALEAEYILTDLTRLLDELSHDSDNWGGPFTEAVGRMVCVMAHEAACEIERAETAISGKGSMGFLAADFNPLTMDY